ncbi:MFS transporter [Francisella halioticida]|uniref:MFS transporter n=1 Tax=Francisella halioticida TaxID=549298 RepID=UPI0030840530
MLNQEKYHKIPLLKLLQTEKRQVIRAISAISILAIVIGFFSLFLTTYFTLNKTANSSNLILLNLFIFSIICIPADYLVDKFGAYIILIIGAIGLLVSGSVFYYAIVNHSSYLMVAILINSIFMGLIVGVATNYASMLFSSGVRASGLGFSYNYF